MRVLAGFVAAVLGVLLGLTSEALPAEPSATASAELAARDVLNQLLSAEAMFCAIGGRYGDFTELGSDSRVSDRMPEFLRDAGGGPVADEHGTKYIITLPGDSLNFEVRATIRNQHQLVVDATGSLRELPPRFAALAEANLRYVSAAQGAYYAKHARYATLRVLAGAEQTYLDGRFLAERDGRLTLDSMELLNEVGADGQSFTVTVSRQRIEGPSWAEPRPVSYQITESGNVVWVMSDHEREARELLTAIAQAQAHHLADTALFGDFSDLTDNGYLVNERLSHAGRGPVYTTCGRIHVWLSRDRERFQAIILVYDGGWLRITGRAAMFRWMCAGAGNGAKST